MNKKTYIVELDADLVKRYFSSIKSTYTEKIEVNDFLRDYIEQSIQMEIEFNNGDWPDDRSSSLEDNGLYRDTADDCSECHE